MKRFLSTLLVAMLIVACLSTAAFAAGQAKGEAGTVNAVPGKTATVTFTVSGEFANYELFVKNDSALELVSITCDGEANTIAGSDKFGKVTFAKGENLTKNTFTATNFDDFTLRVMYQDEYRMVIYGYFDTQEFDDNSVIKYGYFKENDLFDKRCDYH